MNSKGCKLFKCLVSYFPPCKYMVKLISTEKWLTEECCILFKHKGTIVYNHQSWLYTTYISLPYKRQSWDAVSATSVVCITSFLPSIDSLRLCPTMLSASTLILLSHSPYSPCTRLKVKHPSIVANCVELRVCWAHV